MKSLRTTIIIWILTLTIAGGLLYFTQSIIQSKQAVQNTLEEDLSTIAKQTAIEVELQIQTKYDLMKGIANTKFFQDPTITNDEKQDQLDGMPLLDKDLIGINIMDLKGNLRVMGAGYLNFKDDPYFTEPAQGRNAILGPLVNTVTNEMTLFYGAPIKDASGKVMNTLLIAANGDVLCNICEKAKVGKTGQVMIIDREMKFVVGAKDKNLVLQGTNVLEKYMNNPSYSGLDEHIEDLMKGNANGGFYSENGKTKLVFYCPVNGTNYSTAVIVEYSEYYNHLSGLRQSIVIVSIIVVILGLIIAILVGNTLKPLNNLGDAINEIASGNADLTKRLHFKRTKSEIAYVVNGFNSFVEKLQSIIISVKDSESNLSAIDAKLQSSTQDTTTNISDINQNIEDVNCQIETQANSVHGTASAVNEIASNIESLERMIDNQSAGVDQASTAVEEMVGNINSVNASVEKMVTSFKELESNTEIGIQTQSDVNNRIQQIQDQSKMLQEANTAIANIAEQTNLLAMNAAIEAAHAGEAGKGFSVVADEIRKLSETSSSQSKKIGEELNKIQVSIEEVADASAKSTQAFTTVSTSIQNTDQIVHQIKGAMEEQQIGSKQITEALASMNNSTSEVKAAAQEMTEGNKLILHEVQSLQTATTAMKDSIENMTASSGRIAESGNSLSSISMDVTKSIEQIGNEINQFKV